MTGRPSLLSAGRARQETRECPTWRSSRRSADVVADLLQAFKKGEGDA